LKASDPFARDPQFCDLQTKFWPAAALTLKQDSMKIPFLLLLPLAAFGADPALTIYNQNFAVVRERIPLKLMAGVNEVKFADISVHLEPESVILRDPSGKTQIQILEQSFRNDPVNQTMMLSLFEGKELDFVVSEPQKPDRVVKGRVVRSGYIPHNLEAMRRYGEAYYQSQATMAGNTSEPIIEVDGRLQFRLPGMPVFPALTDQTILKPELTWQLQSSDSGTLDAELCYLSGGMSWEADYNLVARQDGGKLDLIGWVTIDNQSGKSFEGARVKLMAGDVSKIQRDQREVFRAASKAALAEDAGPAVTEKSFDEYHLYTLHRPLTLRDRETKQVEFVRASGVSAERIYVYDGALFDWNRLRGADANFLRQNDSIGAESNPKVWVMREFKNSKENGLGIPLPKGRLRFYQRDEDGQLEFVGENHIDHTPKDEIVRVYVGNAFDIVGERRRTGFKVDTSNNWADESFEIILRNRKKEAVDVRVVEHLFRWVNWEIRQPSDAFSKLDAQKVEFRVKLEPDEEKTLTYSVHYSW
jgi:hypothetical protein